MSLDVEDFFFIGDLILTTCKFKFVSLLFYVGFYKSFLLVDMSETLLFHLSIDTCSALALYLGTPH